MTRYSLSLGALAVAAILGATAILDAQQQTPRFRSTVEVTSVDVTVVDGNGRPIRDLAPPDFDVRVDGVARRVLTAEWVPLVAATKTAAKGAAAVPEGYSSNDNVAGGRLIVIAVDQPSIRPAGMQPISVALGAFVDRLSPGDRVAVIGLGLGRAADTPFTADRTRLKQAIGRMAGQKQTEAAAGGGRFWITPAEALAISRGDSITRGQVVSRECTTGFGRLSLGPGLSCGAEVEADAVELARTTTQSSDETIRGLRELLTSLRFIDGPKTLMLVSEGLVVSDQAGTLTELGVAAAAARATLYALQLDTRAGDIDLSGPLSVAGLDQDARDRRMGLEILAQAARGALFAFSGSGAATFDRIQSEIAGYYLLSLETDARDRDGKPHPIRIEVTRRGALVRARRQVLNVATETAARSPRDAAAAAIVSPLLASALPVRVATFPLQAKEPGRVQLLIHADVGTDYSGPALASVGYLITDSTGKTVDSHLANAQLAPVMNGVPSALQFVAGASLVPGEYTLKFVAAEGDRVGSVEHSVHAALPTANGVSFSDLMAGGPPDTLERLQPTVGYTVNFGVLHGYFEAYGPQVEAVTAAYEVATDADSPALVSMSVPGRLAGDDRMIFTSAMAVGRLPPGRYLLRAVASSAGKAIKTLTRSFEIAPPPVLLTSVEGTGARPADPTLFLPVDERAFVRAFRRDDATAPETLAMFRDRVADSVRKDFEAGVDALAAGSYVRAELAFKRAIQPDVDSSAAMAYLAAAFAASGHDPEAAAAWQTALADGAEFAEIYDWLSQALIRTRALSEARAILAEAIGKWPSDPRFTGASASMDALFGNGSAAVRSLERYVTARPDDVQALRLGVEWIYQAHLAGTIIHSQAEDVRLAHAYADAYAKANGPQGALVRQWITYLDKEKR
jgi:VWFA-related protein